MKFLGGCLYRLSLETVDKTLMNVDVIETHLIDDLKLPNAMKENQNSKRTREILQIIQINDDNEEYIELLKENSSAYGADLIDSLLNRNDTLDLYYHDQMILFRKENKFQFSTTFILLPTTNTTQTQILRLLEDGFKRLFDYAHDSAFRSFWNTKQMSTSLQQRYKHIFERMEYTSEEKIELLNTLIASTTTQQDLIKFHNQRARVYFEQKKYKNVLQDIQIVEQHQSSLDKPLSMIKWTSMVHDHIDQIRNLIMDRLKNDPIDDDDGEVISFLQCIEESKINQLIKNNCQCNKKKVKRQKN